LYFNVSKKIRRERFVLAMKRKLLAILLCVSMSVTLLAGCGTKEVDATNEKVTSNSSESLSEEVKEEVVEIQEEPIIAKETYYDREGAIKEIIHYNEHGDIIKTEKPSGSAYTYEYEYDDYGKKISGIEYNDNELDHRMKYEYDNQGNMIKYTLYSHNGSISYIKEYEYDEQNNLIKFVYCDEDGTIEQKEEYQYDNKGNQIEQKIYENKDEISDVKKYEYDERGNVIKYIDCSADGFVRGTEEYEYNENGKLAKSMEFDSDSNLFSWDEYEYDEHGNVIRNISVHKEFYDGEIIEVSGGVEYQNDYNEAGDLVRVTEYAISGNMRSCVEYEYY
jgi:hypothetical protein